jgi:hypothetical protein
LEGLEAQLGRTGSVKKNRGVVELTQTLKSLIKYLSSNKVLLVSSIAAVSVLVTVIVVVSFQPAQVLNFLSPGGNSSNSKGGNQGSETDSNEESAVDGGPSESSSPSASSSSTPSATPTVETESQSEAKQAALTYLNQSYPYFRPLFSRNILRALLQDDGFSASDAAYASSAVSHNWSAEAEAIAYAYIADGFASRWSLITVLGAEEFNSTESNYAASRLEAENPDVWLDEASSFFDSHPDSDRKSKVEALAILTDSTFTSAEAAAVVGRFSSSFWEDSATLRGMDYYYGLQQSPGYQEVVDFLRARGYTQSEIDYAMPRIPLSPDS